MVTISPTTKAVFFDLNGTLIRDRKAHYAAFMSIFEESGIKITREEYEKKVTNHLNRQIWPAVFGHGIDPLTEQKLSDDKENRYLKLLPQLGGAVRGSKELLTTLKESSVKTVLVTTTPPSIAQTVLKLIGLQRLFDDMVTGKDVKRGKPDPEIYFKALTLSKVTADQAIVFEDSPQGVSAALAAGIRTVGVLPEYSQEELERSGVREFINDFTEVCVVQ